MGFHELETLNASYSRIEDEGLVTGLRRCGERLRVVDLKYSQVTKHGMIKMVNRCPRLSELVFTMVLITDELVAPTQELAQFARIIRNTIY
ncbi:hypothetical protein QJS10_CPA02g01215 [Acorus calamus]|uniref:Uncharacterized protein n=1 Tax=Acorus calamus TaxID=4465 RepID=A0AAV9FEU3_ACOCL|nr:hypothetical protein QJS10_CPA02g01215 [Acorus calamus]